MKVKIFAERGHEQLESAINRWLEANPGIKLEHVQQSQLLSENMGAGLLTISLFYRELADQTIRRGFQ